MHGRCSRFTLGFLDNAMWTDFSIVAATKNRMRLENSISRMKDRERAKLHKLEML